MRPSRMTIHIWAFAIDVWSVVSHELIAADSWRPRLRQDSRGQTLTYYGNEAQRDLDRGERAAGRRRRWPGRRRGAEQHFGFNAQHRAARRKVTRGDAMRRDEAGTQCDGSCDGGSLLAFWTSCGAAEKFRDDVLVWDGEKQD